MTQFRSEKACFEASVFIPRGRLFFFFLVVADVYAN